MNLQDIKQRASALIASFLLLFRSNRFFDMYVGDPKYTSKEDPKCPPSWRGSGCYDIEYYKWDYLCIRICARTEQEAEAFFNKWCEAQYDKLYSMYLEEFRQKKRYSPEILAREYATDESFRNCEVLGFLPGSADGGPLERGQLEIVQTVEGQWSTDDDYTCLEEALEAFGVAKQLWPSYAK